MFREAPGGGEGTYAPSASFTARVALGLQALPGEPARGIGTRVSPRRDGTGAVSPQHSIPHSPRGTMRGAGAEEQWRGSISAVGGGGGAARRVAEAVAAAGRYLPGPGGAGGRLGEDKARELARSLASSRASGRGILEALRGGAAALQPGGAGGSGGGGGGGGGGSSSGGGFARMGTASAFVRRGGGGSGGVGEAPPILAPQHFPNPDAATTEDLAAYFKQQRGESRGAREDRLAASIANDARRGR